jgi:ubiquinone/menaquinone biosynthesis C-methylase UbiE
MSLSEEYMNQALWRNWKSYIGLLPIRKQDTIIDIGCSIGVVTKILAEKAATVIGIDNNPELLDEAIKINSAVNISYKLQDAKSLNINDLQIVDGIWTSFLPAYIPDFKPILDNWLRLLKPNGWIAMVEMSDLFGHDPLSSSTHEVFNNYYARQLQMNLYDFKMGSKLHAYLINCGLSIVHEENKDDLELAFLGTAKPEIVKAWKERFDRMLLLKQFLGDLKFNKIKNEFLACIVNSQHFSRTIIKYVIAIKRT